MFILELVRACTAPPRQGMHHDPRCRSLAAMPYVWHATQWAYTFPHRGGLGDRMPRLPLEA